MTPIVSSVEIARPPTEVFEYLTDPSHLPEWQESVVAVQGERPHTVGSTVIITRRVGRMERTMPSELMNSLRHRRGPFEPPVARYAGVSTARSNRSTTASARASQSRLIFTGTGSARS
jgi:hypothetical protein